MKHERFLIAQRPPAGSGIVGRIEVHIVLDDVRLAAGVVKHRARHPPRVVDHHIIPPQAVVAVLREQVVLPAGGKLGVVSEFLTGLRSKPRTRFDVLDGGRRKGKGKYVN